MPDSIHSLSHGREASNLNGLDAEHTIMSPNHSNQCINTSMEANCPLNSTGVFGSKSVHSPSKANENTAGAGVLRYALHLRFLCPLPRKSPRSVRRCKSDPLSVPTGNKTEMQGDRRFYLYSNMKVVFPQRHSDADEGKVSFVCPLEFTLGKCMLQSAYCFLEWCLFFGWAFLGIWHMHELLFSLHVHIMNQPKKKKRERRRKWQR